MKNIRDRTGDLNTDCILGTSTVSTLNVLCLVIVVWICKKRFFFSQRVCRGHMLKYSRVKILLSATYS